MANESFAKSFEELKRIFRNRKISATEVANKAYLERSHLYRILRNGPYRVNRLQTIERIANALGYTFKVTLEKLDDQEETFPHA